MLRRQVLVLSLGILLAAALAYGVERLFALRFEHGDVYPPYSTLRSDPVGAKALYEAFAALPQIRASRNYQALPRFQPPAPVTLIYAGVGWQDYWEPRELETFDALVTSGTRAVFSFLPVRQTVQRPPEKKTGVGENPPKDGTAGAAPAEELPDEEEPEASEPRTKQVKAEAAAPGKEGGKSPDKKAPPAVPRKMPDEDEEPAKVAFSKAAKSWGFQFARRGGARPEAFTGKALRSDDALELEPELSWHSALYFTKLKPAWKTLYACDGKPVIIERAWGRGSIVFASDSYFLSNEALLKERSPHLLAALAGPSSIVFDEEHHGLSEELNLAGLARKYRLQGVCAGLLLIAALFVWQNIIRFVPAYGGSAHAPDLISGQNSAEGFVNLLRRSIPPARILEICVLEWRKTFGARESDRVRIDAAAAETDERDPVAGYALIASRLQRPKALPSSPTSKHP